MNATMLMLAVLMQTEPQFIYTWRDLGDVAHFASDIESASLELPMTCYTDQQIVDEFNRRFGRSFRLVPSSVVEDVTPVQTIVDTPAIGYWQTYPEYGYEYFEYKKIIPPWTDRVIMFATE